MQTTLKGHENYVESPNAHNIRKEFEDFAYIVSHDLNTPLRHLKQFVGLLIKPNERELNTDEKKYLHYIQKSLERLEEMQIALLAYSRINTTAQNLVRIPAEELVHGALNVLSPLIAEYNPSITYENLPLITGDASQIQMVFYHLLSNALKFHKNGEQRKISISSADYDNMTVFEIKDNGIGISSGYNQEVFKMFRKLHTAEEYKGIGAGLTLSKKIIERHGGKIWIEQNSDQGTSVFFSLPKGR